MKRLISPLRLFVMTNREEIDRRIRVLAPEFPSEITDEDRALWVITINEITAWARSAGFNIVDIEPRASAKLVSIQNPGKYIILCVCRGEYFVLINEQLPIHAASISCVGHYWLDGMVIAFTSAQCAADTS